MYRGLVPAGGLQPGRLYSTSSRMLREGSGLVTASSAEEPLVPKTSAGSESQLEGPPDGSSAASPLPDMLVRSARKDAAEWATAAAEMEAMPLAATGARGDRRRGLVTASSAEELLVSKTGAGSETQSAGPPTAGSSAASLPDMLAWSPRKYAEEWGAAVAEMEASASTAPSPALPLAARGDRFRSRTVPVVRGAGGYPSASPYPRPLQEASLAALTLGAQRLTLLGQELRAAEHLRQQQQEQQRGGKEPISAPQMDGQLDGSGQRKGRRPGIQSASPSTEPASKSHNTGLRPGSATAADAALQGLALSAGSEAQRLEGTLLQGLTWATLHEVALVVEAMSEAQQEISPGMGCGLPSRVWAVRQLGGVDCPPGVGCGLSASCGCGLPSRCGVWAVRQLWVWTALQVWSVDCPPAVGVDCPPGMECGLSASCGCGLPSRYGVWAVRQLGGVDCPPGMGCGLSASCGVQALVHTIAKTCFAYE